ncbi:MAG TPA: nuclear transport factor 2 family protein [Blastocatellia bacterium]|nr:nuclear transport factor 2 family protein [Blastocatellia bacterium]
MKRIMIIVAMIVIVFGISSGQTTAKQMKIERELMQMEHDWSAAYLSHDVSVIDRILADDFIGTDGRGIMTDKKQELEDARSENPNRKVLSEAIDDMKVRIYGDTAIVNGRTTEKIQAGGKELVIQYRRTDVFVKRNGRWQCVSFHGSRIIEPPK